MFRNKIRTAIIALATVATLAVPASALAQNPLEWTTGQGASDTSQPTPYGTYTLADVHRPVRVYGSNGGYADTFQDLINSHQTWGVDLDWHTPSFSDVLNESGSAYQWKFVRQGRTTVLNPQISGTERVALYNTTRNQYLADGHETFGVNVVWSSTPRYEWQVANGLYNASTFSVRATELYNTTEQAYLVNGHETWGVDLVWLHAPFSLPYAYNPPQSPIVSTIGSLAPAR
jgi:hypothetical protein